MTTTLTKDQLSCIKWSKTNPNLFAIGTWNTGKCIVYKTNPRAPTAPHQILKASLHPAGILDMCFSPDNNSIITAGCDNYVGIFSIDKPKFTRIGKHKSPVKCVECIPLESKSKDYLIVSGSWDKTISVWNPGKSKSPIQTFELGGKCWAMRYKKPFLFVGTSSLKEYIFEFSPLVKTTPFTLLSTVKSQLKSQIRCISPLPDSEGWVSCSVNGKCAVTLLPKNLKQSKTYKKSFCFKCHREKQAPTIEKVFPVHTVACHPTRNIILTGGADGILNCWDPIVRRQINHIKLSDLSILGSGFNSTGKVVAVISGYGWEYGSAGESPEYSIHLIEFSDIFKE